MNRRFLTIHTRDAIEAEIQSAESAIDDHGTLYPDSTYEDGVQEALRWVLGQCAAPMEDGEHLDHYRGQVIYDREAGEERYVTGSLVQRYQSDAAHAKGGEACRDNSQSGLQSSAACPSSQDQSGRIEYPQSSE